MTESQTQGMAQNFDPLASALRTLRLEQAGIAALEAALLGENGSDLRQNLTTAVAMIRAATGRVIITGMGKSGHVGRKGRASAEDAPMTHEERQALREARDRKIREQLAAALRTQWTERDDRYSEVRGAASAVSTSKPRVEMFRVGG